MTIRAKSQTHDLSLASFPSDAIIEVLANAIQQGHRNQKGRIIPSLLTDDTNVCVENPKLKIKIKALKSTAFLYASNKYVKMTLFKK